MESPGDAKAAAVILEIKNAERRTIEILFIVNPFCEVWYIKGYIIELIV